jgi:glycosyltransferase involved in cell wall biosynthesis
MSVRDQLVSIGLPVRNGERTLESVVQSILSQDHGRMEVVISDNASTDRTAELCRDLSAADRRVVYRRQARNIGLLNNFIAAIQLAKGTFFRWIGDDDWLAPRYVSRCLDEFENNPDLLLVTTQVQYIRPDGSDYVSQYTGAALASPKPLDRYLELMRLPEGMPIDPLYALVRREAVSCIQRRNMIREDEVFAVKLALTGPWGHVPEVLARRHSNSARLPTLARTLGVPAWQAYFATTLQCVEVLRALEKSELNVSERWLARGVLAEMFVRRHTRNWRRRAKKIGQFRFFRQTRIGI